jgi:hypothetical protein
VSKLHVYMNGPADFEVWLDCEGGTNRDGLCIGVGATEQEAYADARQDLLARLAQLTRFDQTEARRLVVSE